MQFSYSQKNLHIPLLLTSPQWTCEQWRQKYTFNSGQWIKEDKTHGADLVVPGCTPAPRYSPSTPGCWGRSRGRAPTWDWTMLACSAHHDDHWTLSLAAESSPNTDHSPPWWGHWEDTPLDTLWSHIFVMLVTASQVLALWEMLSNWQMCHNWAEQSLAMLGWGERYLCTETPQMFTLHQAYCCLLQAGNNTPLSGHNTAKVDTEKEECVANTVRC